MKRFVLLLLALAPLVLSSQVNIERYYRDNNREGFMFSNAFGFNIASGNTNYLELTDRFRVDYNGPRTDYFTILEYNLRTSAGKTSAHKGFVHFRTIYDLDEMAVMMAEGYLQQQFDEFLLLRSRTLLGGGFRFNPVNLADSAWKASKKVRLFIGTGVFLEHESYSTRPRQTVSIMRSSSYLSLLWDPAKNFSINMINYFQPALSDFNNFRYSLNLNMSTPINDRWLFIMSAEFFYRSEPVGGRKPNDLEVKNTFRFTL
ncbi:MAG TPA: DUF481 domain-containing protein [Bacteroidales bacterium]|nr:DUF481 domain-containing protein [Bacteroidales bacterium]